MNKYCLGGALKSSVEKYPDHIALSFVGEESLTYSETGAKVDQIAAWLQSQGIKQGDKVAILSSNQPNWGIAYFGIASIGAVVVPILPDFHENEIQNVLSHSEAKILFISEGLYNKVQNMEIESLQQLVLIDQWAEIAKGTSKKDLKQLTAIEFTATLEAVDVQPNDLASIIYTSGTTGKSKGVMLSHENLLFTAENSSQFQKMESTDRLLSILPLSHTYENTLGLIMPIINGASIFYMKKPPTPSVLLPALAKVKPTIMLSVPLIIEKVYNSKVKATFNNKALSRILYKIPFFRKILNGIAGKKVYESFGGSLKFFGIGGSKLAPDVERFLIEGKFPYAIGYGLTETAPLLAGFSVFQGKHQSTGVAMNGVTLKINNPDPKTKEGEIWAKGKNIMKGYYKEPELTKEVLTEDGWFKTGDLAVMDKEGYLFIKGRSKNMILSPSGENIYPEEIEAVINRFRYVVESIVVQKKGKLVAMVHFNKEEIEKKYQNFREQAGQVVEQKISELVKEVQEYVNANVNKFSRVQLVVVQPEPFEKTATKKIKRFLYI